MPCDALKLLTVMYSFNSLQSNLKVFRVSSTVLPKIVFLHLFLLVNNFLE